MENSSVCCLFSQRIYSTVYRIKVLIVATGQVGRQVSKVLTAARTASEKRSIDKACKDIWRKRASFTEGLSLNDKQMSRAKTASEATTALVSSKGEEDLTVAKTDLDSLS